jgi:cullin 1
MTRQQNRLIQAMLKQIENQRNGEEVDTTLIRKVVDSMGRFRIVFKCFFESLGGSRRESVPIVALGLDDSETSHRANLEVYKEHFQGPFLAATDQYYRAESEAFVAENSISDYLKKAQTRLAEEESRVERYLHSSTRKSVRQ